MHHHKMAVDILPRSPTIAHGGGTKCDARTRGRDTEIDTSWPMQMLDTKYKTRPDSLGKARSITEVY